MLSIIKWELSRRRLYLLWWCLGIAGMIVILMLVYPSLHKQAADLDAVFRRMPESVRALRGGDTNLTSPVGYLNAEIFFVTLPLLFIIMTINLGNALLARDEQNHTLELLLARPISRTKVLLGKATAGLIVIAAVGTVSTISTAVMAKVVNMDIAWRYVLMATALTTLFATSFGAITFALNAASLLSRRFSIAVAVVASFGGYILQSLSAASDYIKTPAKFFPYHYFIPRDMLVGTVSRGFILYMVGILVVCALLSYVGFRRRDLN